LRKWRAALGAASVLRRFLNPQSSVALYNSTTPNKLLSMADFTKILQQAQQMQGRLQQIQEELANKTVTGVSGGGMVSVTADGKGQVRAVKLDPSVVNPSDIEMLEDLIAVAVVDAQKKAADLAQEEMRKLTGGLPLPFKLPL
jgi:DNA-binding YbaB/EbfC family protein